MRTITKKLFSVFFIAFIAMSLLVSSACDKDDDEDEMVGTWVLYEATTPTAILNAAALAEMNYSMTVVFTATTYTAVGSFGDESINEIGTWIRQDSNTVIITNSDGNTILTKDGEYYKAELDDNVIGKFKKL